MSRKRKSRPATRKLDDSHICGYESLADFLLLWRTKKGEQWEVWEYNDTTLSDVLYDLKGIPFSMEGDPVEGMIVPKRLAIHLGYQTWGVVPEGEEILDDEERSYPPPMEIVPTDEDIPF